MSCSAIDGWMEAVDGGSRAKVNYWFRMKQTSRVRKYSILYYENGKTSVLTVRLYGVYTFVIRLRESSVTEYYKSI
jgi:hypothetical protein